jgi:hypothetical protein
MTAGLDAIDSNLLRANFLPSLETLDLAAQKIFAKIKAQFRSQIAADCPDMTQQRGPEGDRATRTTLIVRRRKAGPPGP